MYEAECEKISNVKMTLETQVMNLESAAQNADTFMAMKGGTTAMKKIRNDMGVDKVDDMIDEIREEMDAAKDLSDAMAQQVDPMLYDEDELLGELAALEEADTEKELLKPTPSLNLPAVPGKKLPSHEAAEAEELRKLEAELAGM